MPARELDEHLADCAACAGWADDAALVTRRARLAAGAPGARPHRGRPGGAAPRAAGRGRGGPRRGCSAPRCGWRCSPWASRRRAWPGRRWPRAPRDERAGAHGPRDRRLEPRPSRPRSSPSPRRPRLAAGALPFLGTFAALLVPVTLADLGAGHVHADRAVAHLLLLAGRGARGVVAWRGRRRRAAAPSRRPAGARVRRTPRSCSPCSPAGCWPASSRPARRPRTPTLVSTDPGDGARLDGARRG